MNPKWQEQMSSTARDVALLAPVPFEHLADAKAVCEAQGKAAFGSRAWETFRKLDSIRDGLPVDVFIYASHSPGPLRLEVSWHARYTGHVDGLNGAHPAGMRFRPASTGNYADDNSGHWAIFWEVEQLHELSHEQRIKTMSFQGYEKRKPYKRNFVPEGPTLIQRPALRFL
jgi:hypothetical protein